MAMVVIVSAIFGDLHARGLSHVSRYCGCGACDARKRRCTSAQASVRLPMCSLGALRHSGSLLLAGKKTIALAKLLANLNLPQLYVERSRLGEGQKAVSFVLCVEII